MRAHHLFSTVLCLIVLAALFLSAPSISAVGHTKEARIDPPSAKNQESPVYRGTRPHSKLRTPEISDHSHQGPPSLTKMASCDDAGYGIKTGQALVDHIRDQPYADGGNSCANRLFSSAAEAIRFAAFQKDNMLVVGDAAKDLAVNYDGTNSSKIEAFFLFLRAGYYNRFYNPSQYEWGTEVGTKMSEAIDAFVANTHFYDNSDDHALTLGTVLTSVTNASLEYRYVGVVRQWLQRWNPTYAANSKMSVAVNQIFNILFFGDGDPAFRTVVGNDSQLIAFLGAFARYTWIADHNAEYMAENAGWSLTFFLSYPADSVYAQVKTEIQSILNTYTTTGPGKRIWITTATNVNRRGDCADFNLCGFEATLKAEVLPLVHQCSPTLRMVAQEMTAQQFADSCALLAAEETYFHQRLETNEQPVADDQNTVLEMVIYNSSDDYRTYSYTFFGNDTDNGGIYLEGNPAQAGNQARFLAYEQWSGSTFRIWNLEHEYVHYLDGRFNLYGDFATGIAKPTTWWAEGLAEYISVKDDNPAAFELAKTLEFPLSEIFTNTYNNSQDRIYRWGYLAVRFMFENRPSEVDQLLAFFRTGNYDGYDTYRLNTLGTSLDAEWNAWLPLVDDGIPWLELTNGQPVSGLAADLGERRKYYIDVPTGATNLSIATSGGTGNLTLITQHAVHPANGSFNCRPYNNGNDETCVVPTPAAGRWFISLEAGSAFSGVTLTASYSTTGGTSSCPTNALLLDGGTLQAGVTACVAPRSSGGAAFSHYLPTAITQLTAQTSGGSGNADLYHKYDGRPSTTNYDQRSAGPNTSETVTVANPGQGWHYYQVEAEPSFTMLTILVTHGGGAANSAPTVAISAPTGGTSVAQGTAVTFTGSASDPEDGNLSSNLSWSTSNGGNLGTGASFSTNGLAVGEHTVTASVTDTGGLPGSAQVTLTVTPGSNGPQTANYDAALGAPQCSVAGSSCDSATLLDGRAALGPEPNQPNTLDTCTDGTQGTYHSDESIDRIVITRAAGGNFTVGDAVQIDITAWIYATVENRIDVYSAADANNPAWTLIGTLTPPATGAQTLSANYTLPAGDLQAVRARIRYNGSTAPCGSGGYDDYDDLVFAVASGGGSGGGGGGGNTAPAVAITAPSNGVSVTQGTLVTFTGSATDAQDGNLSSSLGWSSSVSGNLGSGASFPTASLPVGDHTVTASVTDSGGLTGSAQVTLSITPAGGGNVLQNGVPVSGLSGAENSEVSYTMNVPAGASNLTFQTSGGDGDADLYVRFGAAPTTTTYDCRPWVNGNAETCNIANIQAGTYHVLIQGYNAYTGLTLQGSYSGGN